MELIKIPEAELEVMQAIWEKEKEGAVSSKVLTDYFLEKNNWKRTTTLKILGRLEKKNFLKIDREFLDRENLHREIFDREETDVPFFPLRGFFLFFPV